MHMTRKLNSTRMPAEEGGIATTPLTITDLLIARCTSTPHTTAFLNLDQEKCWQKHSWSQFEKNVSRVSSALIAAGIKKGDRIGILAPTSLNWEYAQMGAFAAGATVAGIDHNNPTDQLEHIFSILNLSVLFVQDQTTLAKISPKLSIQIKLIVLFEGNPQHTHERTMSEIFAASEVSECRKESARPAPQDAAVIVFTSGTTDFSKAIIYTHEQVLIAIDTILCVFNDLEAEMTLLCWLPLANLFQRIINFCAISIGASSYLLNDPRDLMNYLGKINPQILIGVPKVFERIHNGIMDRIEKEIWLTRKLIYWGLRVGYKQALIKPFSSKPGLVDTLLWHFADKMILRRLRGIFGLRIRYFVSGSAAMPMWLLEWYESIGLPVLEAYGISENIVPNAINKQETRKLGTVGKPLTPNEIIIALDKEILVRGPGVFHGYWGSDSDSDLERFTTDGYWRTGDLGLIDKEGFLSVTGRKNEAFKTPGGKWVIPTKIETQLQRITYIEQGIIFPLDSGKTAAILSLVELKHEINNDLSDKIHADLEAALNIFPVYQRPIGIIVTMRQFSISSGELTANLKLRRKTVIDNFTPYLKQLEGEIMKSLKHSQPTSRDTIIKPIILFI